MIEAGNLAALDGVRHGFFTREGGVSEGVFESLNCGLASGDDVARVAENRCRAMAQLGIPPDHLCTVRQVHSARVLVAREGLSGPQPVEADALVTGRIGMALGVVCADCAPVLIADREGQVIGCAHAGWRGALAGVIEATVDAMTGLGAQRERMSAAVGPCIAQASYEVGPELLARFVAADPASEDLFAPVAGSDRLLLDLKGYVLHRLAEAGIEDRTALPDDTMADEARFFSARRTRRRGGVQFGLLLSAIALTK
jgi:purine-nucleoside/S-methyl-5'-thioadenosine phosphorylase / adenosine deaminase